MAKLKEFACPQCDRWHAAGVAHPPPTMENCDD
jgi:hypothetical protein